jgi:hypothetical protein
MLTGERCAIPRLAASIVCALGFGKRVLEGLLGVGHSFHKRQGHFELVIANGADKFRV